MYSCITVSMFCAGCNLLCFGEAEYIHIANHASCVLRQPSSCASVPALMSILKFEYCCFCFLSSLAAAAISTPMLFSARCCVLEKWEQYTTSHMYSCITVSMFCAGCNLLCFGEAEYIHIANHASCVLRQPSSCASVPALMSILKFEYCCFCFLSSLAAAAISTPMLFSARCCVLARGCKRKTHFISPSICSPQ